MGDNICTEFGEFLQLHFDVSFWHRSPWWTINRAVVCFFASPINTQVIWWVCYRKWLICIELVSNLTENRNCCCESFDCFTSPVKCWIKSNSLAVGGRVRLWSRFWHSRTCVPLASEGEIIRFNALLNEFCWVRLAVEIVDRAWWFVKLKWYPCSQVSVRLSQVECVTKIQSVGWKLYYILACDEKGLVLEKVRRL